jgi:D-glycero-D-manno-heptose 1,7-bisphosphate phosphatase
MRKALFLDRDGVVNREVGYLSRPDEVQWVDGIWELCAAARAAGYLLIVVTNQSGIARGLYTEEEFHSLMRWMGEEFVQHGVELAAYYYCAHHPIHGVGPYKRECEDRKPGPGMLLRAAAEFGLDLEQCVMVGDRCSDIGAANAAGVGRMYLLAGTEDSPCAGEYWPVAALDEVRAALTVRNTGI